MEVNLMEMNKYDIYKYFLSMIDEIYHSFMYLGLTNDEYEKMVFKEIDNLKIKNNDVSNYLLQLKNKIEKRLTDKVRQKLNDNETRMIIINNYIKDNFINITNYNEIINSFIRLNQFLIEYNLAINADLLIEMFTNNGTFFQAIGVLADEKVIQLEDEIDNYALNLTLDAYYSLSNAFDASLTYDTSDYAGDDIIDIYLREIGQIPLLSFSEERELAMEVANGSLEAKKELITHNLKFVVKIANQYINPKMALEDLIQEGNMGLMRAVNKFDVNKGVRFVTYAAYWIHMSIRRALANKSRNIRIPVGLYTNVGSFKRSVHNLRIKNGKEPSISEIAKEMEITDEEATKLYMLREDTISINDIVGIDDDREVENFIPSLDEDVDETIINNDLRKQILNLFEKCHLKDMEIKVLLLRFGFITDNILTFRQIGEMFHVSKQRISQVQKDALLKIRNSGYAGEFAVYMEKPDEALKKVKTYGKKFNWL